MSSILKSLNELSNDTLASYKKKAGDDATSSDKAGDIKKADKRFSGIVKATKKQFANDEKQEVAEDSQRVDSLVTDALKIMQGAEVGDAIKALKTVLGDREYNSRRGHYNFYVKQILDMYSQQSVAEAGIPFRGVGGAFNRGDDERHDLDVPKQQVWALKINGRVDGSNVFNSKEQALKQRLSLLSKNPESEIGLVTKGGMAESVEAIKEGYIAEGKILLEARITRKLWENAGQKIAEAQLTADQINQIFQYAEKIQTAGGANRTMLGKGKDAAGAVSKAWEELKTKVQNSGPIQNVDAMYDKAAEQLKQATGGDQGVMQYVQKYRDFAKTHPVAQSLIYAALIGAAGISGAGVGGAAALGLFKMVDKLVQGEKFSSSAYQGAKTGGMAYAAGQIGQAMKGGDTATTTSTTTSTAPGITGDMSYDQAYNTYIQKFAQDPNNPSAMIVQQAKQFAATKAKDVLDSGTEVAGNAATNVATSTANASGNIPYDQAFKQGLAKFAANPGNPSANDVMRAKDYAGKVASGMLKPVNESIELTESQLYLMMGKIVERQHKLDEGIMDTVKGAAGKAMNWAQTKGTNLTTKITADKLLQAWKKAGSPMDSLDVASIVQQAGVPSDTIKQVYGNMKIPFAGEPGANTATRNIQVDPSSVAPPDSAPAQAASPGADATAPGSVQQVQTTYAQVKKLIDQLDKKGKQRVVTALKKSLGLAVAEGSMGAAVSQPPGSTVSAGQRFYKPRHVPNQDELQKQDEKELDEEKQRLDPSCWKGYRKQGTKMKGNTRVNNCVPIKESSIMQGVKQLDEGWKEKLSAAALAGSMALGAAGAHARVTPDGQGGFTGGLKPTATVTAPSDDKPATEAPKGFSQEYLQKAANPDRVGRYLISVEKAQELLKQGQGQ